MWSSLEKAKNAATQLGRSATAAASNQLNNSSNEQSQSTSHTNDVSSNNTNGDDLATRVRELERENEMLRQGDTAEIDKLKNHLKLAVSKAKELKEERDKAIAKLNEANHDDANDGNIANGSEEIESLKSKLKQVIKKATEIKHDRDSIAEEKNKLAEENLQLKASLESQKHEPPVQQENTTTNNNEEEVESLKQKLKQVIKKATEIKQERDALVEEKNTLQGENQSLKAQIENNARDQTPIAQDQSRNNDNESIIHEKDAKIESLTNKMKELIAKFKVLKETHQSAEENNAKLTSEIEQLRDGIIKKESETSSTADQMDALITERVKLKEQVEELASQLRVMANKESVHQETATVLQKVQESNSAYEAKIQMYENEQQIAAQKILELEQEIQRVVSNDEQQAGALASEVALAKNQLKEFELQNSQLKSQLENHQCTECPELRGTQQALEADLEDARSKLNEAQSKQKEQLELFRAKAGEMKAKVQQEKCALVEQHKNALEQEATRFVQISEQLATLERKSEDDALVITNLQEELKILRSSNNDDQQEHADMVAQMQMLRDGLQKLQDEATAHEEELASRDRTIQELSSNVETFQRQLEDTSAQLSQSEQEIERIQRESDERLALCKSLEESKQQAEENLENMATRTMASASTEQELRSQIRELEEKLKDAGQHAINVESLKESNLSLVSERDTVEKQLHVLQDENLELKNQRENELAKMEQLMRDFEQNQSEALEERQRLREDFEQRLAIAVSESSSGQETIVMEFQQQETTLKTTIESLRKTIREMETENVSLKQTLQDRDASVETLQHEITLKRDYVAKDIVDALQYKVNSLEDATTGRESRIEELESEIALSKTTITDLQERCSKNESLVAAHQEEASSLEKSLRETLAEEQRTRHELEKSLDSQEEEIRRLSTDMEQREKIHHQSLESLQCQLRDSMASCEALSKTSENLTENSNVEREQMRVEIESLQQELANRAQAINDIKQEMTEQHHLRERELESKLEQHEKSLADMIEYVEQRDEAIKRLQSELEGTESEAVMRFEETVAKLNGQISLLVKDLDGQKAKCVALEREIEDLRVDANDKEKQIDEGLAARNVAESALLESQNARDTLERELEKRSDAHERMLTEMSKMESKMEELQRNATTIDTERTEAFQHLQDVQESLTQERDRLIGQIGSLQSRIQDLEADTITNSEKLQNAYDELQVSRETTKALESQVEEYTSASSNADNEQRELLITMESLRNQVSESQERLRGHESETNVLRSQLESLETANLALGETRDQLSEQIGSLEAHVQELKREISTSSEKLQSAYNELQMSRETIKALESKVEHYTSASSDADEQHRELMTTVESLRNQVSELQELVGNREIESNVLRSQVESLESEKLVLGEKLIEMERCVAASNTSSADQVAGLMAQVANLEREKEASAKQLAELQSQCSEAIELRTLLEKVNESHEADNDRLGNEVESLESKVSALEKTITGLQSSISDKNAELLAQKQLAEESTRVKNELEMENDRLQSDIALIRQEHSTLHASIEESAASLHRVNELEAELEQANAKFEEEKSRIQSDFDSKKREIVDKSKQIIITWKNKEKAATDALETNQKELEELKAQLEGQSQSAKLDFEAQLQTIQEQLQVVSEEKSALEISIAELSHREAEAKQAHEESLKDWKEKNASVQEEVAKLSSIIETLKAKEVSASDEIAKLTKIIQTHNETIEKLQYVKDDDTLAHESELRLQYEKLREAEDRLSKAENDHHAYRQKMIQSLKKLKNENVASEEKCSQLSTELIALERKLEVVESMEQEVANMKSALSQKEEALTEAHETLHNYEHKLQESDSKYSDLEARHLASLSDVNAKWESKLQAVEEKSAEMKRQMKTKNDNARQIIDQKEKQLVVLETQLRDAQDEAKKAQIELKNHVDNSGEYQFMQLAQAQARRDGEVRQLREQVESLELQLRHANKELEESRRMANESPSHGHGTLMDSPLDHGRSEYLKNVMIRFLQATEEERLQLVPVIGTILHFSKTEFDGIKNAQEQQQSMSVGNFFSYFTSSAPAKKPPVNMTEQRRAVATTGDDSYIPPTPVGSLDSSRIASSPRAPTHHMADVDGSDSEPDYV